MCVEPPYWPLRGLPLWILTYLDLHDPLGIALAQALGRALAMQGRAW